MARLVRIHQQGPRQRRPFYSLSSTIDDERTQRPYGRVDRLCPTADVEIVMQRALDTLPKGTARPRLITDNGSQYVSGQFKIFLRDAGCAHSKARVRHPQSNGKIERWHKSIKTECVRRTPLGDLEEAREVVAA